MFEVKLFDFADEIEVEFTLFRSHYEVDCWSFVRNHLTCANPKVKHQAKKYIVMDSQRRCYDPSMDVVFLRKYAA